MKRIRYGVLLVVLELSCHESRTAIDAAVEDNKLGAISDQRIQISGFPEGYSRETELEINIVDSIFTYFRYKVTNTLANPCSREDGYSEPLADEKVLIDISEFDDGEISLCFVGGTREEWQKFDDATIAVWTKKTIGPYPALNLNYLEGIAEVRLTWQDALERDDVEFLLFRADVKVGLPLLTNGKEYEIGSLHEQMTLVFKGKETSYLDLDVLEGKDYYYYLFVLDSFLNYSEAKIVALKTFGQPYEWVPQGLEEVNYYGSIEAGSQPAPINTEKVLYICRVILAVDKIVPGQLLPGTKGLGDGVCNIVDETPEGTRINLSSENYEVLLNTRTSFDNYFSWELANFIPGVQQMVPSNAMKAGNAGGENLYACRTAFENRPRPGKIASSYDRCQASAFNGTEYLIPSFDAWQVLSIKPRPDLK